MAISVGLDLGSKNIRIVELEKIKNNFTLNAYGSIESPLANSIFDSDEERKLLANTIKQLVKDSGISKKKVNIALPEAQCFTQIIQAPLLTDKELKAAMDWQAEQYIPLPLEEVSFDYQVVSRDTAQNKMRILISAAPLKLVDKFSTLLEEAGLETVGMETQILSVTRNLSRLVPENITAALINIGHNSSDFAFITQSVLLFTRTIPTGGGAISRAIASELGFSPEQAERYKKAYGIDQDQLEGKVYIAVKPLLDQFLRELNRAFIFFKEHFPQQQVDLILISGGGSLMPGLVAFMTNNFGIEVQRGDPFANFAIKKGLASPPGILSDMVVATGLAMREDG